MMDDSRIAFIGGGNMASAIVGGLIRQGMAPAQIAVVEPFAEQRARLQQQFGIAAEEHAGAALAGCGLVVWAVKPQTFRDAAVGESPQERLHSMGRAYCEMLGRWAAPSRSTARRRWTTSR